MSNQKEEPCNENSDWSEVFHDKNRYYITRLIYQEAFAYESQFDRSQETVIVRKIRTQGSPSVERKKKGKHIVCLKLITENVPVNWILKQSEGSDYHLPLKPHAVESELEKCMYYNFCSKYELKQDKTINIFFHITARDWRKLKEQNHSRRFIDILNNFYQLIISSFVAIHMTSFSNLRIKRYCDGSRPFPLCRFWL